MSFENFPEKVEQYIEENQLYRVEGKTGVQNLCKVIGALGITDPQYFGQFQGGSYGQLINFLEDNPGAVEAVIEWIKENGGNDDWEENLDKLLPNEDDEEFEDD